MLSATQRATYRRKLGRPCLVAGTAATGHQPLQARVAEIEGQPCVHQRCLDRLLACLTLARPDLHPNLQPEGGGGVRSSER